MLTTLQMPDDERAYWHQRFSCRQLALLEGVRATAWRREYGLPGYERLEYVRWLVEHGHIGEQL